MRKAHTRARPRRESALAAVTARKAATTMRAAVSAAADGGDNRPRRRRAPLLAPRRQTRSSSGTMRRPALMAPTRSSREAAGAAGGALVASREAPRAVARDRRLARAGARSTRYAPWPSFASGGALDGRCEQDARKLNEVYATASSTASCHYIKMRLFTHFNPSVTSLTLVGLRGSSEACPARGSGARCCSWSPWASARTSGRSLRARRWGPTRSGCRRAAARCGQR